MPMIMRESIWVHPRKLMAALPAAILACSSCFSASDHSSAIGERPLYGYEELTYRYRLTKSIDDRLCSHMERVYNDYFSQPWNHRPYFRENLPAVIVDWYSAPSAPKSETTRFAFDMRYALHPLSSEFSAVSWKDIVRITRDGLRLPTRLTHIDIDNDGKTDTLIQYQFFGAGDHRTADDGFVVWRQSPPPEIENGALTHEKLFLDNAPGEHFTARILRLFLRDGVTYLSEYMPNVEGIYDSEMSRHLPPEKMYVRKYVGGQGARLHVIGDDVCEFEMNRIVDPFK